VQIQWYLHVCNDSSFDLLVVDVPDRKLARYLQAALRCISHKDARSVVCVLGTIIVQASLRVLSESSAQLGFLLCLVALEQPL
jgi:hypothetical protein